MVNMWGKNFKWKRWGNGKITEEFSKYFSKYKSILVLGLIIIFGYLIIEINENNIGPTSQYDWAYFEKNIEIKKENSNESVGHFYIKGVVRSKGIISPAKPAEFIIFEMDFSGVRTESLPNLCEGYVCSKNVTVDVCLQGYNARGYNKSEKVQYPYQRNEPACFENMILYNHGTDGFEYVSYSHNKIGTFGPSNDFNKEVVFITSGPQSLRIWNFFGYPYDIENVFEVSPYHFYSELQLTKYAFLLALIGLIVVIIEIINFNGFNKYYSIISILVILIVCYELIFGGVL